MTSTDEWRRALPTRREWVSPPAYALVGFAIALVLSGWFFLYRHTGQVVDQLALLGAESYGRDDSGGVITTMYDGVARLSSLVGSLISVPYAIVIVALIIVIMIVRRGWWQGLGALAVFVGANLTTQAIKMFLTRPDLGLYPTYGNSWPSGHTMMAAAAAAALLLVTTARARWVVAMIGAVFTMLMAWGTVMYGWHRPSDTVAAICVSAIWYVLVETIRRSVMQIPLEEHIENPVAIRVMDVLAGVSAALGVGILAALILTLPDTPVGDIEVATKRLAFLGAFFGIGTVAFTTNRILLAVGPREENSRD